MDTAMILIFLGFVLAGVIIGWAIAFPLGQRHILNQLGDDRRKDYARRARYDGAVSSPQSALRGPQSNWPEVIE